MRAILAATLAALASASPPQGGLFVPGVSLGGVRLGMTETQVRAHWGTAYGVCKACAETTWYYNYVKYRPQGLGVSFKDGRVDSVFTVWASTGWHTPEG